MELSMQQQTYGHMTGVFNQCVQQHMLSGVNAALCL